MRRAVSNRTMRGQSKKYLAPMLLPQLSATDKAFGRFSLPILLRRETWSKHVFLDAVTDHKSHEHGQECDVSRIESMVPVQDIAGYEKPNTK